MKSFARCNDNEAASIGDFLFRPRKPKNSETGRDRFAGFDIEVHRPQPKRAADQYQKHKEHQAACLPGSPRRIRFYDEHDAVLHKVDQVFPRRGDALLLLLSELDDKKKATS